MYENIRVPPEHRAPSLVAIKIFYVGRNFISYQMHVAHRIYEVFLLMFEHISL